MRKLKWAAAIAAVGLFASAAWADLTVKDGSSVTQTLFNFTCFTTKICPSNVLINSAGTEIATSSNPVRTDPTGTTTQPVSAASLPLPTGAATAAKQPALGTAGSASTDVLTVQGAASMTPLFIQSGTAPVSTLNSASAGTGVTAAMACNFDDTTPTSVTENNFGAWRCSANRNGYMTIRDAAGNERGVNVDASNRLTTAPTMVPGSVASGAYASGAFASGSVASGAFASGALASGSVASGAMVDLGAQADAVCGTATGSCSLIALMKYNNSTNPALSQGGSALSTTNGIYTNLLQGNAVLSITNPLFIQPAAGATGGASTTGNIVANNTTAVVVKASAGKLYGVQLAGIGSAPAYLKIYNAISATCGSGTPVKRLMIPAASTAANGAGSNITFGDTGVDFSTGITYCVTTGIGDADTTAPAASTYLVNLDWK